MLRSAEAEIAIVQRGRVDVFDELRKRDFADVIWDRRLEERRKAAWPVLSDWRRGDRRQQMPDTWETYGYIVVPASHVSAVE